MKVGNKCWWNTGSMAAHTSVWFNSFNAGTGFWICNKVFDIDDDAVWVIVLV